MARTPIAAASATPSPATDRDQALTSANQAFLVTPEQFVRHIKSQFGVDLAQTYQGQSSALQRYLLPLGGLDHDTTYERDRNVKVQTLLAVQAIAWEAATRIMEQQQKPKLAKIFLTSNPNTLTTDSDPVAWAQQLDEIFIASLSRLSTENERIFFQQQSREMIQSGATPGQVWTAVLGILLSSMEFWYL